MPMLVRYATTAVLLAIPVFFPGSVLAQKWEVGGFAGGGFYKNASVSSPAGSGDVGFKNAAIFGGLVGSNMYKHVGGELRYEYRMGDQFVKSGGTEATFGNRTHSIHYDFLMHFAPEGALVRPFVSAGGGVRIFTGTGTESAAQPLSRLALLTNTTETKGLGVVGAGLKIKIAPGVGVRAEVHDFITPFPRQVIAPSVNASISGILHDIVATFGIFAIF
jgi:outer membrane protein with beta-barrel domain